MRKLVWFTLGFALACGLAVWVLPGAFRLPLVALGLTCFGGGLCWKPARAAGLAALGLAAGLCWYGVYDSEYLQAPRVQDGLERNITLVCSDYSYDTRYGSAVDGVARLQGKPYLLRIYLDDSLELAPGDTVTGRFRLRLTAPGGAEESTHHAGKGMFLLAYEQGDVQIQKALSLPDWCRPALWRQRLLNILDEVFSPDLAPFAKALLLGESYELDYATDTALQLSGIRHIVAVSGLHISILFGFLSVLTAKNRILTALLGIPALCAFASVVGFSPSVLRACIMCGLMMAANLVLREYDPPTALAFAAFAMLVGNPLTITSVSFQLSVGCVAGILLFSGGIQEWLADRIPGKGRTKAWFCSGVAVTLSAMSLTTPLSAYYFGYVSLVSVVTNLLTLWVVTLIFGGVLLVCGLYFLSAGAASLLAGVLAWPMGYVLGMADFFGGLPFAAVYTRNPYAIAWLVLCYLLLVVFLFCKKKRPLLLSACAAAALLAAILVPIWENRTQPIPLTVLDVGQGQAILLQSEGHTYLVDCGGDSETDTADILAETLLTRGITRLDGIILTHSDWDHAGALENLLTRIDAEAVYLPQGMEPIEGENTIFVPEELVLSYGTTKLRLYSVDLPDSQGEKNLCVLFEPENCAILITGDLDAAAERRLLAEHTLPKVDVLIAGHHGSKYATCEALLQAVDPDYVFISVGAGNPYGHPARETLERLAAQGCTVSRTDIDGTLIFRR